MFFNRKKNNLNEQIQDLQAQISALADFLDVDLIRQAPYKIEIKKEMGFGTKKL